MTWVAPPGDFDPHSLAEFVEAELLLSDDDYMSKSELRAQFSSGGQPTDVEIDAMLAEVERRAGVMGDLYPFAVEEAGVRIRRDATVALYGSLLLLSLKGTPVRADRDYARSDPVFDEIARHAFQHKLGDTAVSLTFAWPPRDGRPTDFVTAVGWVAERIGVPLRGGFIPDHPNDAGVDVIVWAPFPDGRAGFPIYLVQNTIQWSYVKKPRDVVPSRWRDWLEIGAEPSVGFAVPFMIPEGDIWWDDVIVDVAMVMDRQRLLAALDGSDPEAWECWPVIHEFYETERLGARELAGQGDAGSVPRTRRKRSPDAGIDEGTSDS